MTPAHRKAKERQRRRDAGETLIQVWVKPQHLARVKDAVRRETTDDMIAKYWPDGTEDDE